MAKKNTNTSSKSEETDIPGVGTEEKDNEFQQAEALAKAQAKQKKTKGDWVPLDEAALKAAQENGTLVGYDPKTQTGLLKKAGKPAVEAEPEDEE